MIPGRVGPAVLTDGVQREDRLDRTGAAVSTDAHGRYMEASLRGMFFACNSAAQALSLGSLTATGIILSNTAGSGKNLVICEILGCLTVEPTADGAILLFANVNTVAAAVVHTTPLVVRPTILGATSVAVGLADSAATLPATPIIVRPLLSSIFGTAVGLAQTSIRDDVGGALIIAPGAAVSVQAVTTAVTGIWAISWEEQAI